MELSLMKLWRFDDITRGNYEAGPVRARQTHGIDLYETKFGVKKSGPVNHGIIFYTIEP